MALYNLSYDLHADKDYAGLETGIKAVVKNWARPLKSTWLVEYDGDALELVNAVRRYADGDDSFLATRVTVREGTIAWCRLSQEVSGWINTVHRRLVHSAAA